MPNNSWALSPSFLVSLGVLFQKAANAQIKPSPKFSVRNSHLCPINSVWTTWGYCSKEQVAVGSMMLSCAKAAGAAGAPGAAGEGPNLGGLDLSGKVANMSHVQWSKSKITTASSWSLSSSFSSSWSLFTRPLRHLLYLSFCRRSRRLAFQMISVCRMAIVAPPIRWFHHQGLVGGED